MLSSCLHFVRLLAPREEERAGSLLLSPFLISPSSSTCFSLVIFIFFRCFLAICINSDLFRPPSKVLCRQFLPSAPPRTNADQCPSSSLLQSLLFLIIVFLVLNKDRFRSRMSRSSILRSRSVIFWVFLFFIFIFGGG